MALQAVVHFMATQEHETFSTLNKEIRDDAFSTLYFAVCDFAAAHIPALHFGRMSSSGEYFRHSKCLLRRYRHIHQCRGYGL
jgi:hypothetical protein